jgi:beta-glucuronidase
MRFPLALLFAALALTGCTTSTEDTPKPLRLAGVVAAAAPEAPLVLQNTQPIPTAVFAAERVRQDLGGTWRFVTDPTDAGVAAQWFAASFTGDAAWRTEQIPGSWNHDFPDLFRYFGLGWYRLRFTPTKEMLAAPTVRLRFEGIFREGTIWLNGEKLGKQDLPYLPFEFDVKAKLAAGENVLAVRIDNEIAPETLPGYAMLQDERLGWWKYGGLTRDVYLEAAPQVRVFRVHVTPSVNAAGGAYAAQIGVWNAGPAVSGSLTVTVTGPAGGDQERTLAAAFPAGASFFDVHSAGVSAQVWTPAAPHLFTLTAAAAAGGKTDVASYRFGLRTFRTAGRRLLLNGKPYYLLGMNRHEDHPAAGPTEPAAVVAADLERLRALNVNHLRTVHYPNRESTYDRLDEAGFTAQEEIPLYQSYAEYLLGAALPELATRALTGMVLRDFNHPSIIIWSVGNEDQTFESQAAGDVIGALIRHVKSLDASRPVLYVSNVLPVITERVTWGVEHADILAYNQYFGWFYGKTGDLAPFIDAVRKNFPDKPMIFTEWGAEAIGGRRSAGALPDEEAPDAHGLTEDFQAAYFKKIMGVYASRDDVMGQVPWVFADHFVHWEGQSLGYGENFAEPWKQVFGLYRYDRTPKLAADVLTQGYAELSVQLRARGIETYR